MLKSLAKAIALLALLAWGHWQFFGVAVMLSGSMAPTLKAVRSSQDVVLVDRVSLKYRPPERGEIVHLLVKNLEKAWVYVFKRVTGLPGERFEIRDGKILINDRVLDFPKVFQVLRYENEGYASAGVILEMASESYFVLGDNSSGSYDSRYWGAIKQSEIRGLATMIIWPPRRFGAMVPK